MPLTHSVLKRKADATLAEEPDDATLLDGIACRQDREAFAELFKRYERVLYGVAYNVSGRGDLAEDAVQEAMLRVWQAASSFKAQGPGSVRAWLLRIVVRECLTLSRRRLRTRHHQTELERDRQQAMEVRGPEAADALEEVETLAALRDGLLQLPPLDRQLVTLAYGAGMTQREMGEVLAMPHETISYKLNKALDLLRSNMARAGLVASAPLVVGETLGKAITSGYAVPPGLREKVLLQTQAGSAAAQSLSRRGVASPSSATGWLAAGIVLGLGAGGAAWWALSAKPSAAPAPRDPEVTSTPMAASPTPPQATPAAAPSSMSWSKNWPFDKGPAQDIPLSQGTWQWRLNPQTKQGEMYVNPGPPASLLLPCEIAPNVTCSVTMKGNALLRTGRAGVDLVWTDGKTYLPCKYWMKVPAWTPMPATAAVHVYQFVVTGRYGFLKRDQVLCTIYDYGTAYPTRNIALLVQNLSIQEVSMEGKASSEMPKEFEDPEALIRQLGVPPTEMVIHEKVKP